MDVSSGGRLGALERTAGVLSLVAGGAHGTATQVHFEAWWGYGLFFVFATAAQVVFGLLVLTRAINPADTGARWRVWRLRMWDAGAVGNLLIMAMYVVSRTAGVPLGPDAGYVEPVGAVDVVSKLAEAGAVACLVVLARRERRLLRASPVEDARERPA